MCIMVYDALGVIGDNDLKSEVFFTLPQMQERTAVFHDMCLLKKLLNWCGYVDWCGLVINKVGLAFSQHACVLGKCFEVGVTKK